MKSKKKEPKDSVGLWLYLGKLTTSGIIFGRLILEIVKLYIER